MVTTVLWVGLMGCATLFALGGKHKRVKEIEVTPVKEEKDYTTPYTKLFINFGLIDESKGDWVKCYGFKEFDCYRVVRFKLSDTLSYKDFVKVQSKIAEKLQVKDEKFEIYTDKGYMCFKIINDTFPVMNYKRMNIPKSCISVGYNLDNKLETINLCSNPHILIGGVPTSGKSILQHDIICHLLESTKALLWLIDLKAGLEFNRYKDVTRVMALGKELGQCEVIVKDFKIEMERRFDVIEKLGIQKYEDYIEKFGDKDMPRCFLIIDEFADIMSLIPKGKGKEGQYNIIDDLVLIGRKSRAVGMHMIIATQRMNATSIDTNLKAVCTGKIGLRASSAINSEIILDHGGLEKLENYQAIYQADGRETFVRTMNMDMDYLDQVIKKYS